ncbi:MAG TPA: outer membrane beta-barrel protein [Chryseolinea sp.]|nr:outer membrane beta-barrel protein [Chryseolinea sp.]
MILLMAASSTAALAQTSQGTLSFGGSVTMSATKTEEANEDVRRSTFLFSPSVGYFVIDNLMVGADLTLSTSKEDDGFGGDDKTHLFGFGPFARYYIFTSNEQFAFTAEAGFGFGALKQIPDGQDETKGTFFNFYVSPGFTFFPTDKWGIDFQVSAINFTATDPDKDTDNDKFTSFQFGLTTFSPSLGIRYYLSK